MIKEVNFKLHSLIDVITNSSTQVFVMAGDWTKKAVFELVDQFLKLTDIDKKAEDIFDVGYRLRYYENEPYVKFYIAKEILKQKYVTYPEDEYDINEDSFSSEVNEYFEEFGNILMERANKQELLFKGSLDVGDFEAYENVDIVIKPKEGYCQFEKISKLLSNLNNIFEYSVSY